jgi:hypothetical protein
MQNGFEFYFGVVDTDQEYMELEDLFQQGDKYYYFKMVVEDEMFAIHDTCNRIMPFDRSQIDAMNMAMFGTTRFYNALKEADQVFEKRMNETSALMDFWNNE